MSKLSQLPALLRAMNDLIGDSNLSIDLDTFDKVREDMADESPLVYQAGSGKWKATTFYDGIAGEGKTPAAAIDDMLFKTYGEHIKVDSWV